MNLFAKTLSALAIALLFATSTFAQSDLSTQMAEWSATSKRAEDVLASGQASTPAMEQLRAQLVTQRAAIMAVEQAALGTLSGMQKELAALGPVPADGSTEAPEIATRRASLNQDIALRSIPLLAAQAARTRAEGLASAISISLRRRFTDGLIERGPTPVDPTLWLPAIQDLANYSSRVAVEVIKTTTADGSVIVLKQKLPLILFLIAIGVGLLVGFRRGFRNLVNRGAAYIVAGGSRQVFLSYLASPIKSALGVAALVYAITISDINGIAGSAIVNNLPIIAAVIIGGPWLGRAFFLSLGDPSMKFARRGWRLGLLLGLFYGLEIALLAIAAAGDFTRETRAVLQFPIIIAAGIVFVRFSQLVLQFFKYKSQLDGVDSDEKINSLIVSVSRILTALGYAVPIVAGIGYFAGSQFLVFPTMETLALGGSFVVVFALVNTMFDALGGADDTELLRDPIRLIPVFIGFLLAFAAVPLLALIWGASANDLRDVWVWLNDGVSIGNSQFSLSDFVLFVFVFSIGITLTRIVQRIVKKTVLPRTHLDIGGRSAITTGLGYVGIFFAALASISATGLDLSNLAIVAGALSVGVGFGLQTIVSNFVSGIILLIERPIKEGDWIVAGGFEGIVRKISVRATLVDTFDRSAVIIPNSELIASSVQNWTAPDMSGRIKIPVGVAYGTNPELVQNILLELGRAHPHVSLYPEPKVIFQNFGASALEFELRVFLDDINNSLDVHSDINFQIAARFDAEGIEIPFDQSDVTLKNVDEIAAALDKTFRRT